MKLLLFLGGLAKSYPLQQTFARHVDRCTKWVRDERPHMLDVLLHTK